MPIFRDALGTQLTPAQAEPRIVSLVPSLTEFPCELGRCVPHVVVTHPNTPEDNIDLFRLFGGIFRCESEAAKLAAGFRAAPRKTCRVAACST